MLFAPVVTVPLMSVGGMPVGVQLMGQQHEDARMTGIARWFSENLKRIAVPACILLPNEVGEEDVIRGLGL